MTRREFDALTKEHHDGSPQWGPDGALAYAARRCRRWRIDILEVRRAQRYDRPDRPILARGTPGRAWAERARAEGRPLLTWPGGPSRTSMAEAWAPLPLPEGRVVGEERAAA